MNPYQTNIGKVYFFTDGEYIKIGFTTETIGRRLQRVSTGSPKKLFSLGYTFGTMDDEYGLHVLFDKDRLRPDAEWFKPSEELLDYINAVNEYENKCVIVNDDGFIQLCDCIPNVYNNCDDEE